MKAFLTDANELALVLTTETPDELSQYRTLREVLAVSLPKLEWVDPVSIEANTNRGIYRFGDSMWIEPMGDTLEALRDNGEVRLIYV